MRWKQRPQGSNCGDFGPDDRIGRMNLVNPEELAQAWTPSVHTCIDAFGPTRAMFESNFPVDKSCCTYRVIWNTFKRMADGCSDSEKTDLFAASAVRTYRLPADLARSAPEVAA